MFRRLKIISVFLLLFLIFLPSLALSQTSVGKFTFVQGRVDVLRQPAPRAMPVKMGDVVFVGDIIRAKSASKAEITFKDGNIVRVASNTRVEISEYMFDEAKGKGILKLSRGKVQAIIQEKIAKRIATFGEANRFEIHTPTAILGVRGTNFIVLYQRNSSSVFVWEGTVLAYSPKFPDMAVTVNAGYITTIPFDQPAQPARPATDAEKKMYEGDFAQTEGSGEKSEAEDTVISEATTAPAEPGVPEPGPESPLPTGNLTETPQNLTQIVQPPPISGDPTPPVISITGPPSYSSIIDAVFNVSADETVTFKYVIDNTIVIVSPNTSKDSFKIPKLPEGPHALIVTATDQSGNSSTANYTWTVDITDPFIENPPPPVTKESTARFDFNETVKYKYVLDNDEENPISGEGSYFVTNPLSEESHTIKIISATDLATNSMTTYEYEWTTDYTDPSISLTPVVASPEPNTTATVNIELSSNEPVTYSYKLDGGEWTDTGPSLIIPKIPEGGHMLKVQTTDLATRQSPIEELSFDLSRYSLTGNFYGCIAGVYGTASGKVAGVSDKDWGGWIIDMNGSGGYPNPTWTVTAGGRSSDNIESNNNGYWLLVADGNTLEDGSLTGTSTLKYLSLDRLGIGKGIFSGTYYKGESYEYTLQDVGSGAYTETPLAFGGNINSGLFQWDQTYWLVVNGGITGLMGVADIDGSPSFLSLGTYDTNEETNNLYNGVLWGVDVLDSTPDNGALLGVTGGVVLADNEIRDSLVGGLRAIYIKPTEKEGEYDAGIIISDNVIGSLYPEIGMYELGGNLISLSMGTTEISPSDLNWDGLYGETPSLHIAKGYGTIEGDLEGEIGSQYINLTDQNWGAWWATSVSYYTEENPLIPSTWIATAEGEIYDADLNEVGIWGSQITGSRIDTDNKLIGTSVGYLADISSTPITAISVGETFGTFDPNVYTWQAISMGAWIETNKFIEMTQTPEGIAKLQQLNIPCVEVGRATLTGSGNNFTNLSMTDTIFFAPNSSAKPTIWATGNVGGTYTAPPTLDSTIGLSSDSGLNAAFTFKTWDSSSGKWLSTVNGTGGFNGSTSFQGAGAGTGATSGSGNISGTAAGIAR